MKLGKIKITVLSSILFFISTFVLAEDKIETVPLINLEELSATFEEEKDELEKMEENSLEIKQNENNSLQSENVDKDKVYINLIALDKITAKTSEIRLAV